MKILVVDDQPDTLALMQEMLEAEGYQVLTCHQSHESLKILEENEINCVVTDLRMPILRGGDLVQIIRKKYPKIPVIVISGHLDSRQEILDMGAYDALAKPVDIEKLVSSIQEGVAECANQIIFQFNHIRLKKIKDTINKQLVRIALKKTGGNQMQASKLLGISRQSLIRYIKRYQLNKDYSRPLQEAFTSSK